MNYTKSLMITVQRCVGQECKSEDEIDQFINRLIVSSRAEQNIIKFDTENKTNNLRRSLINIDRI